MADVKVQSIKLDLLGGKVEIIIYDVNKEIIELMTEEITIEAERLEKIFNFYDPKSELSELNQKRELVVSDDLSYVLKEAIRYGGLTEGQYDISKGKNFLQRKNRGELTKLDCSFKDILVEGNRILLKHKDVLVDLGSIAKGYIADKLVQYLKDDGVLSGLIDARGDIIIFGDIAEVINIQHPRDKARTIGTVQLHNSAIATSGDYNQSADNYAHCHILNQKELISVSVVTDTLMEADAIASAIFVSDVLCREKIVEAAIARNCKIMVSDKKLNIYKYGWAQ